MGLRGLKTAFSLYLHFTQLQKNKKKGNVRAGMSDERMIFRPFEKRSGTRPHAVFVCTSVNDCEQFLQRGTLFVCVERVKKESMWMDVVTVRVCECECLSNWV